MAKSKIRTAVVELPVGKHLSPAESMSFVLAERDLQLAQMQEKQATTLLRAQELEAHIALTATKQQVEDAKAKVAQAKTKHARLSGELAGKYSFDWQTSCFDPITGSIEPLSVN